MIPNQETAGHRGSWGPVNVDTHNLYEELPCMFLVNERVRRSLVEPQDRNYVSDLDPNLNGNAIGFGPVSPLKLSQRQRLCDLGYTPHDDPQRH